MKNIEDCVWLREKFPCLYKPSRLGAALGTLCALCVAIPALCVLFYIGVAVLYGIPIFLGLIAAKGTVALGLPEWFGIPVGIAVVIYVLVRLHKYFESK